MPHRIAIIGAGPRGTYCLRRLALALQNDPPVSEVHIHVIEKSGRFGGGGVHSPYQPEYLLLNTIGSQITAFGDDDQTARKSPSRRTLYGYLKSTGSSLGPDDYPSRAAHGRYLAEMFDWAESRLNPKTRLFRHTDTAMDIEETSSGRLKVFLENDGPIDADEVLLLTGHAQNRIPQGHPAEEWGAFAEKQKAAGKNMSYIHFVYPIHKQTAHIRPEETVYVIGMGLTAVDVVRTLTIGRGGSFEEDRYIPSGKEPKMILASRLGLPYSARGRNQKTDRYQGIFLSSEAVSAIPRVDGKMDFTTHLFPLIKKEMALVYYQTLLGAEFAERLKLCKTDGEWNALIAGTVPEADRFDWERLDNPLKDVMKKAGSDESWFASLEEYERYVIHYLEKDIAEAAKGNMTSPLKTAVDAVLRDLRDTIRAVVDRGGLTAASHYRFVNDFNRLNNRIAVGPPVESTRNLMILARQGLVSFSGPNPSLEIDPETGSFFIESREVVSSRRSLDHVLNGRIHGVDSKNDASPLFINLFKKGAIRTFTNRDATGTFETGGLDVDDGFHLIDANGNPHPHLCALGIPLEGKFWFNAADARPDVESNAIGQLSLWASAAVRRIKERSPLRD